MTTDLRDVLRTELDTVVAPPGDLDRVRAAGTRIRRRRGGAAGTVAVLAVGVLVAGFALGGSDEPQTDRGIDPIGQLDFSQGLRAYADPGNTIYLGGREFGAARMEGLDTDATATPYGVLFYSDGRPWLLDESGVSVALEQDDDANDNHPTAKVDSQGPLVAYGDTRDGDAEVVVLDQSTDEVVARQPVPAETVIDGLDGGVVLLRTKAGTTAWDSATDEEQDLAGPRTRVADVRNGVLLYDGPAPDGPAAAAYRLVPGAIDAQLTYDGAHVLYWSNKLESTDGGNPIVLDQKATFFAVDTDGSILAAGFAKGGGAIVYDCEVPSGTCTDLGPMTTKGGDPAFIGVDM